VGRETTAVLYLKIELEDYAMTLATSVGYLAATLVFATFCTRRMVPLRALAIASNIAFIGYGYLGELWPILILHVAILPMNTRRLWQEVSLRAPRRDKMRPTRDVSVLRDWDDGDLRDIADIVTVRASAYKLALSDNVRQAVGIRCVAGFPVPGQGTIRSTPPAGSSCTETTAQAQELIA